MQYAYDDSRAIVKKHYGAGLVLNLLRALTTPQTLPNLQQSSYQANPARPFGLTKNATPCNSMWRNAAKGLQRKIQRT